MGGRGDGEPAGRQRPKRAVVAVKQVNGSLFGLGAGGAIADQDRDEFGIRHCMNAVSQQASHQRPTDWARDLRAGDTRALGGHRGSFTMGSMNDSMPPSTEHASDAALAASGVPRVALDSHLTLHYRLTLSERGADLISTFGGKPATLQLGIGQLAEPLERCLLGLTEGDRRRFELPPGEAFGPRNPALIQRLSRAVFDAHTTPGTAYEPGDLVELPAPGGGRYAGVLKEITDQSVLFDFNHPLAGQALDFEVEILGVL